ncbi:hypothetical protein [Streptomyces sp. NPDC006638]|uniref:hypothetical protein n=1 Tax=unclassified Streptomyces TaxID=2593676 RepID=UPI0033B2ED7F
MNRLGWTLEQKAGVKRYFAFTSFFAIIGVIFSAFLIATGNQGGWGLLAIVVIGWGGMYAFLRNVRRSQP